MSATTTPAAAASPAPPPLGTQWDVSILDDYLHSLLLGKFLSSLDPLLMDNSNSNSNSNNKYERRRTIQMILGALLPAATLWMTQLQTPATKAVGLRTVMTNNNSNSSSSSNNGNTNTSVLTTKFKYIFLTAVLPLLYQLLQRWIVTFQQQQLNHNAHGNNNDNLTEEEQEQQRIARERQYQLARTICQWVDQLLPLGKLGLLLSMLWQPSRNTKSNGLPTSSFMPPRLAMALAGISFLTNTTSTSTTTTTTTTTHPRFYVLYAHRRWLMEESLQTLKLFFGPILLSVRDGREWAHSNIQRIIEALPVPLLKSTISSTTDPQSALLVENAPCALCGTHPINIPYETDVCDHVFCYTCLWKKANGNASSMLGTSRSQTTSTNTTTSATTNNRKGTGYPCPVCHRTIRSSRPVPLLRYRQAAAAAAAASATARTTETTSTDATNDNTTPAS